MARSIGSCGNTHIHTDTHGYRKSIDQVVLWVDEVRGLRIYPSFSEVLLSEKNPENLSSIPSFLGTGS